MKESTLVRRIMDAVYEKYPAAYVRKLSDRFTRGIPDIMVVFKDHLNEAGVLFVETKDKDGVLSKIQIAEHDFIRSVGAEGCQIIVARDVNTVIDKLATMGAING